MVGAIAGDIIGSIYEFEPIIDVGYPLFHQDSFFTDDTVLTVAVADCLMHGHDYVDAFHRYFDAYPMAGWGGMFREWAQERRREPYNSFGNGSAMRVSPVGYAFNTIDEVMAEARRSAEVTHDHPEGIRGAQATATSIFLARRGAGKRELRDFITSTFGYDLSRSLSEIRPDYRFDETCQGSVPQSIIAFLESNDYESAVRHAISLGGDADTMACIAGGIAEACYGVPNAVAHETLRRLDRPLRAIVEEFQEMFRSTRL